MSVSRLFHTLKYLKPGQVLNRVGRRFSRPRLYKGSVPGLCAPKGRWQSQAVLPSSFNSAKIATFLNETGPLFSWENPARSKLWLYNLHYFDDLVAEGAQQRVELHQQVINQWLIDNTQLTGTGWAPYPTSLRIVNWIKWLVAENPPVPGMLESLTQQAYVLSQQIEYHLLGNHILANAKALVFAGSFFEGKIADHWLKTGIGLLDAQLEEQILEDGAHFERSPMYHSIILVDVLDLIQLGILYPDGQLAHRLNILRKHATFMSNWLSGLLHPDGNIPFFNDATFGIAPEPSSIRGYAQTLGIEWPVAASDVHYFNASGYIAIRQYDQVTLLDVAQVGPDYIPGHAHADTLSFEWSLFGQRVFVNSGISEYGLGNERLRQRQTAAHNTVVVDGQDSSEVWSGFRVGLRARPFGIQVEQEQPMTWVKASHNGYQRLPGKVTHSREWKISPGELRVKDSMEGKFNHATAYFHLHPQVSAIANSSGIALILPNGYSCQLGVTGGHEKLETGFWHPQFGISQSNQCIVVTFSGSSLETVIRY